MKKLIYIFTLFAVVLLLDSCSKEEILSNTNDAAELDTAAELRTYGSVESDDSDVAEDLREGRAGSVVDDDDDDDDKDAMEDEEVIEDK